MENSELPNFRIESISSPQIDELLSETKQVKRINYNKAMNSRKEILQTFASYHGNPKVKKTEKQPLHMHHISPDPPKRPLDYNFHTSKGFRKLP